MPARRTPPIKPRDRRALLFRRCWEAALRYSSAGPSPLFTSRRLRRIFLELSEHYHIPVLQPRIPQPQFPPGRENRGLARFLIGSSDNILLWRRVELVLQDLYSWRQKKREVLCLVLYLSCARLLGRRLPAAGEVVRLAIAAGIEPPYNEPVDAEDSRQRWKNRWPPDDFFEWLTEELPQERREGAVKPASLREHASRRPKVGRSR